MSIQSVWLLQAGLIQALAKVLKQGGMGSQVREGLSEALKHLTASSQKNRDTLVASQALPIIIAHLRTGHPHASLLSAHFTLVLPCLPAMLQQAAALYFVPSIGSLLRAESVHSCVQVTHLAAGFLVFCPWVLLLRQLGLHYCPSALVTLLTIIRLGLCTLHNIKYASPYVLASCPATLSSAEVQDQSQPLTLWLVCGRGGGCAVQHSQDAAPPGSGLPACPQDRRPPGHLLYQCSISTSAFIILHCTVTHTHKHCSVNVRSGHLSCS